MIERIKKYFTEKPKSDFWMWAFITLFLLRYVTPYMLVMMIPLQVGLVAPEVEMNYTNISQNLADNFIEPLEAMNEVGRSIAIKNPVLSKIIFHMVSYFIYCIWISILLLLINFIRYGTSYLFFTSKKNNPQNTGEGLPQS